jgi:hypothetical protein
MNALKRFPIKFFDIYNVVHESAVALNAIFLKDLPVALRHDDRLMEILECKSFRMAVTIIGFGDVLSEEVVR